MENIKELYRSEFELFEKKLNGDADSLLHSLRKEAMASLEKAEFPTQKNEEWKYTNVKPILDKKFVHPLNSEKVNPGKDFVCENTPCEEEKINVVFVNGIFDPELSAIGELPKNVVLGSLNDVMKSGNTEAEKYFTKIAKDTTAFDTINKAYSCDGFVLILPDGAMIEKPIHILFVNGSNEDNLISVPRNLIVAGKNSNAKIIFNYMGYGDKIYFTNTATELFADENAVIDLYKIEQESKEAFHVDKTELHQKKNSVVSHGNFSFGGAIVRNDIISMLDDENIECNLTGLYLGKDKQHVDNRTFVDHAKPDCMSNELYKGILDDEAHGVFNGKIMVRKDAQKTNAYQSNKTILLNKSATIDTKPQLEIYADDVKCSHGATVGQLDETAYFYIRSRGVPADMAKSMLIHAFAEDVLEKVKIESLKEEINHMIFENLKRVEI